MLQNVLFVINPRAGSEKSILNNLKNALGDHSLKYDFVFTKHPGHAKEITENKATDYDAIVAVGGDGTVNEIVNGLKNQSTLLGIVPIGTGNDFARSCQIPIDSIAQAINVLTTCRVKKIDLGEINGIRFINAVGIGFDGYANNIAKHLGFIKGKLKYLISIPIALLFYSFIKVKIDIDNHCSNNTLLMLSIANGKFVGDDLPIAPEAELDDGQFNIVQVAKTSRYRVISQFRRMQQGHINDIPEVTHQLATSIRISAEKVLPIHYDGEVLENTKEVKIEMLHHAINLIC